MNTIECAYCHTLITSYYRHDFAYHTCGWMQKHRGPDAMIAADGGRDYFRRVGYRADYIERRTDEQAQ